MKVALLTDAFARETRFGLGRYSHELRTGLLAEGISVIPSSAVTSFGRNPPDWLRATEFVHIPVSRKLLSIAWSLLPEPRIERWIGSDFDLLHSTDVDYAVATRKPWITTFHDLGVLTHPSYFKRAHPWLLKRYVDAAAKRAAAIICVSQATASEVLTVGGKRLIDRLHVVPEGVSEEFFVREGEPLLPLPAELQDTPFFLFTGSINPRKNLLNVLMAFEKVTDKLPHRLVLTGAPGWDAEAILAALETSPWRSRVVDLGYVSDLQLKSLYRSADGFLYPSLYEGFGLPILEAMAAGCPVITSAIQPLSEVAGDAALCVDPLSVNQIADAMLALSDASTSASLRARGIAQARRFSWQACAEATLEIYRAVA